MAMKKGQKTIGLGWLAVALPLLINHSAHAAALPDTKTSPRPAEAPKNQEPVYQACDKVLVVTQEDFEKNKGYKDLPLPGQCSQVQSMPRLGFFQGSISDIHDKAKAMEFTSKVCEKVKDNYQSNLSVLEKMRDCFAPASTSRECENFRDGVQARISEVAPQLRKELALAFTQNKYSDITRKSTATINAKLNSGLELSMPNPIQSKDGLTAEERKEVQAIADEERKQVEEEAQKEIAELKKTGKAFGFEELFDKRHEDHNAKHLSNYKELLYGKARFMAYLKPKDATWVKGRPTWSNESIRKAFGELVENTRKRIETVDAAMKENKLEMTRWDLERFRRSVLNDDMDLMDCMMFKPAVEETLKENQQYCGMATGLTQHIGIKEFQNGFMIGAGAVVATVATAGAAAGVGAVVGGAAVASTSAMAASATLGLGFTAAMTLADYQILAHTERSVLTRSGLDDREKDVMDPAKLKEVEDQLVYNGMANVIAPAAFPVVVKAAAFAARPAVSGLKTLFSKMPTGQISDLLAKIKNSKMTPEQKQNFFENARTALNELNETQPSAELQAAAKTAAESAPAPASAAQAQKPQLQTTQSQAPSAQTQTASAQTAQAEAAPARAEAGANDPVQQSSSPVASVKVPDVKEVQKAYSKYLVAVPKEDQDEIVSLIQQAEAQGHSRADVKKKLDEAMTSCALPGKKG